MIFLLYVIYTSVLIFSLVFLVFFFHTIKNYKHKGNIPTIYIYLMIFCNFVEVWMEIINDVMPVFFSKVKYDWFYKHLGKYVTLIDNLVYSYPMFLTVLMVAERVYILLFPLGKAFGNGKLWFYCLGIAIWTHIFAVTPMIAGCPVIFDYYTMSYLTDDCEHFFTYLFNNYTWVIPVSCMSLNIIIIFYISYLRKKTTQNNPDTRKRWRNEKIMLSQSVACTTFLITYEITEHINSAFEEEYLALPDAAQRTIYYIRDAAVGLTCFFIYFIGTPAIRNILLDRAYLLITKKSRVRTVTVSGANRSFNS